MTVTIESLSSLPETLATKFTALVTLKDSIQAPETIALR